MSSEVFRGLSWADRGWFWRTGQAPSPLSSKPGLVSPEKFSATGDQAQGAVEAHGEGRTPDVHQ